MTDLLNIYIRIVNSLIQFYHKGKTEVDPVSINRAKILARSSIVLTLYAKGKDQSIFDTKTSMDWLKQQFRDRLPLISWLDNLSHDEFNLVNVETSFLPTMDLGEAYEILLSVDNIGLELSKGKSSRNVLGSYYSPKELVDNLTQRVIQEYTTLNGVPALATAKIADFSSGAGAFLVSAVNLIVKELSAVSTINSYVIAQSIIANVYACDVDCIALEVCKFKLIDITGDYSLYKILSDHFEFGNFLLYTNNPYTEEEKESLYLNGYVYHNGLSVDVDFMSQYDIILGNPPWEKIRFEEKKFYSQYMQDLNSINFKDNLRESIDSAICSNGMLRKYSEVYQAQIECSKQEIKANSFFQNSTVGELNTSTLFADACYKLRSENGVVGIIIKSSTVLSPVNKFFFKAIKDKTIAIYDFINKNRYFNIDSRERFAFLVLGQRKQQTIQVAMNLVKTVDIEDNTINISDDEIRLLNPQTGMIPNISSVQDLDIILKLHKKFACLGEQFSNLKYGRIVHYTNHVTYLDRISNTKNIPVYEGKFFSSFDGMYSGYNAVSFNQRYVSKARTQPLSDDDKQNGIIPESRFYIRADKWKELSYKYETEYMVAWHSLSSATNGRACVATILPFMPASQSVQFLTSASSEEIIYLNGVFNSIVFDYLVKNKMTGIDLTQTIIKQIPIPSLEFAKICKNGKRSIYDYIYEISSKLLWNDRRLHGLFLDSSRCDKNKKDLFLELDVVVASLYGIGTDTLSHISSYYPKEYDADRKIKLINELVSF